MAGHLPAEVEPRLGAADPPAAGKPEGEVRRENRPERLPAGEPPSQAGMGRRPDLGIRDATAAGSREGTGPAAADRHPKGTGPGRADHQVVLVPTQLLAVLDRTVEHQLVRLEPHLGQRCMAVALAGRRVDHQQRAAA